MLGRRQLPHWFASLLIVAGWLSYFTALQWSVVRYRLWIVLVLTGAGGCLTWALSQRHWLNRSQAGPFPLPRRVLAVALLFTAGITEFVPFFSHSTSSERRLLAHVMAATAILAAVCLVKSGRLAGVLALTVAAVGVTSWTTLAIWLVPAPKIDVWVTLQQATDGMANGINPYTMVWENSPGVQDAFTYLPWTAVLLAPGRLLAGDVRWALLVILLLGLTALVLLGLPISQQSRPPTNKSSLSNSALGAALLLALAPGSITQAEQAWTEPVLFTALAIWALLVRRGHSWWAVLPLALGCASKQHLALLLPVIACWPGFGWRRTLATVGASGALVLPWFLDAPADFWNDTVALLATFPPIRFANTWFIAAQTELDTTPPFWLTGAIVLGTIITACFMVRRRKPDLSQLLWWLALVLLAANLVNKQAFYNQFWLVGALVALGMATHPESSDPEQLTDQTSDTEHDGTEPSYPQISLAPTEELSAPLGPPRKS